MLAPHSNHVSGDVAVHEQLLLEQSLAFLGEPPPHEPQPRLERHRERHLLEQRDHPTRLGQLEHPRRQPARPAAAKGRAPASWWGGRRERMEVGGLEVEHGGRQPGANASTADWREASASHACGPLMNGRRVSRSYSYGATEQ